MNIVSESMLDVSGESKGEGGRRFFSNYLKGTLHWPKYAHIS